MNLRGRVRQNGPFVAGVVVAVAAGIFAMRRSEGGSRSVPPEAVAAARVALDNLDIGYALGSADAPIEVIEVFDFECPACAQAHAATGELLDRYLRDGIISFTGYNVPIPGHRYAVPAAVAERCLAQEDVGAAWRFRDALFRRQDEWLEAVELESTLVGIASDVGADSATLRGCLHESAPDRRSRIDAANAAVLRAGISWIPLWAVNGQVVPPSQLEQRILERLEAS